MLCATGIRQVCCCVLSFQYRWFDCARGGGVTERSLLGDVCEDVIGGRELRILLIVLDSCFERLTDFERFFPQTTLVESL